MAPLTRFRANKDHIPLADMVAEHYAQRCSEPGGLIIAEANIIAPEHGGVAHMPGIYNSAQIAAWKKIVDAVHAKGCYIFAQLISIGRVANADLLRQEGNWPVISSSPTPYPSASQAEQQQEETNKPGPPLPHPLTPSEIHSTIHLFTQAARNAIFLAGFDGIECHGANGYLIDQFTQSVCNNHRRDEYGGNSIPNRARFALELTSSLISAVGNSRVGFRLSPFSTFQGMKMQPHTELMEQFGYLVGKLKEQKLAYLHLVESRVVNNVDCEKQESILPFLEIWAKTSPVLVAGGFTPESAREAVDAEYDAEKFDVAVVFGRHYIANPDLPFRIRHGLKLNPYDRSTFYTPERVEGYLDCPFSDEYLQQRHQVEKQ